MLQSISRLVVLTALCLGVAGSVMALPAGSLTGKPNILAKAVLAPTTDASGYWQLTVSGPPGTAATASWAGGAVTATAGVEGAVNYVRFIPPQGAVFMLVLSSPGKAPILMRDIGGSGAILVMTSSMESAKRGS